MGVYPLPVACIDKLGATCQVQLPLDQLNQLHNVVDYRYPHGCLQSHERALD